MLDAIKQKVRDEMRKEIKSNMFAQHLNMIERFCKSIKQEYPDIALDDLVAKLSDVSEKAAEEHVTAMLAFQEQVSSLVQAEINTYKQVKVAA